MSDENKLWRAQTYALLATLLSLPPKQDLLNNIAAIEVIQPKSPMGEQWMQFLEVVKHADVDAVADEFQTLFIGVTHGELIPYGSYYQTGFLMEEPVAILRTDLAKLGLARQEGVSEPEDHIAAEFDVMRLILMAEGTPIVTDDMFFKRHLQPWVMRFFDDLVNTEQAVFYRALAKLGLKFIQLEQAIYQ